VGEHCYWAAYLKLSAAAAVAAAAAAEAAGPDGGEESKTTHKLLSTSLTSNQIPSASSWAEETRHIFHCCTCNSVYVTHSHRALDRLVAFAAYLQSEHQFYSYLRGTTKTPEPLSTPGAMDMESKATSCNKLQEFVGTKTQK